MRQPLFIATGFLIKVKYCQAESSDSKMSFGEPLVLGPRNPSTVVQVIPGSYSAPKITVNLAHSFAPFIPALYIGCIKIPIAI